MNQMLCDFCEVLRPCIELLPADADNENCVAMCSECLDNAIRAAEEGCDKWEA